MIPFLSYSPSVDPCFWTKLSLMIRISWEGGNGTANGGGTGLYKSVVVLRPKFLVLTGLL